MYFGGGGSVPRPGGCVLPHSGGQVLPPCVGSGRCCSMFSNWHCESRPPSSLPQRAGTDEWPTSRYPSGQDPQTGSMFTPKGTHCASVGSPPLQSSGASVTPVVAYPSGHFPQVLRMLFGSAEGSSAHVTGGAAGRRRPKRTSGITEAVKKLVLHAVMRIVIPSPAVSRFHG